MAPFDTDQRTPLAYRLDRLRRQSVGMLYEVNARLASAMGAPELAEQIRGDKPIDGPTCACTDALCGHNDSYGKHSQTPVATPGMLCEYCQEDRKS